MRLGSLKPLQNPKNSRPQSPNKKTIYRKTKWFCFSGCLWGVHTFQAAYCRACIASSSFNALAFSSCASSQPLDTNINKNTNSSSEETSQYTK